MNCADVVIFKIIAFTASRRDSKYGRQALRVRVTALMEIHLIGEIHRAVDIDMPNLHCHWKMSTEDKEQAHDLQNWHLLAGQGAVCGLGLGLGLA